LLDAFGVIDSRLSKVAGRDENPFVGLLTGKRPDETLDFLAPDDSLPPLRLAQVS